VNPFFFGRSESHLFGAYDSPPAGGARGAVLCYPFGREYLLAHGTFRLLARSLSAAGYHVLRFDYSGTGDSAGELADASEAQWIDDIHAAIDETKDLGQLGQVALIGMRYGGALAALAARGRRDVDRLVLWDPTSDGASYLASVGAPVLAAGGGEDAGCEVSGVVLTPRLRGDIEHVTHATYGHGLPRTLLLTTGTASDEAVPLRDHLTAVGVACTVKHVPDIPAWATEWGRAGAGMPVVAVNAIVGWMT